MACIETLVNWDKALFRILNGWHSEWMDPVMNFITGTWVWVPFYGFIIFLLGKNLGFKKTLLALISVFVLISLSDQISSGFLKPFFERLRPCHDPEMSVDVHVPYGCGGMYGFVSSHASNTFALAAYLFFIRAFKKSGYLFAWAALVSYSRIYLGVHYVGDILGGVLLGIFLALLLSVVYKKLSTYNIFN